MVLDHWLYNYHFMPNIVPINIPNMVVNSPIMVDILFSMNINKDVHNAAPIVITIIYDTLFFILNLHL